MDDEEKYNTVFYRLDKLVDNNFVIHLIPIFRHVRLSVKKSKKFQVFSKAQRFLRQENNGFIYFNFDHKLAKNQTK